MNYAIPLGLIFNELITNALKYAFPLTHSGEITFNLSSSPEFLKIQMSDNGVGLPDSIDPMRSETFGFRIIRLLVEQLSGKLDCFRSNGTTFVLTVPAEDAKN
jgi:two-component sensor histidine kinase